MTNTTPVTLVGEWITSSDGSTAEPGTLTIHEHEWPIWHTEDGFQVIAQRTLMTPALQARMSSDADQITFLVVHGPNGTSPRIFYATDDELDRSGIMRIHRIPPELPEMESSMPIGVFCAFLTQVNQGNHPIAIHGPRSASTDDVVSYTLLLKRPGGTSTGFMIVASITLSRATPETLGAWVLIPNEIVQVIEHRTGAGEIIPKTIH